MWKPEHRGAAGRRGLRYPRDLTDAKSVGECVEEIDQKEIPTCAKSRSAQNRAKCRKNSRTGRDDITAVRLHQHLFSHLAVSAPRD